uniref:Uncharacterized protein n=1 Tax=Lobelia siphilitica var. siphilitica TaxID=1929858 RepID=A0A1L6BUX3_LOBSI|nr:hypothetical protein Lo_si_si1Pt0114 [Lobelia siphilitica var. siphilitica]
MTIIKGIKSGIKPMNSSRYFGGTGYCRWITLDWEYNTHPLFQFQYNTNPLFRGCSCQTSEVNSELATTPVVEISTTEEGRATPERLRSETHADTDTLSLCQCPRTRCPRTRCPRKPGQNKKRKRNGIQNKKRKINGIQNRALETNGSLFQESNDDPVSHPECCHYSDYQHECYHSEEFPCGDGNYSYCKSHGELKDDPEFIFGQAEGAEFIRALFELDARHSKKILRKACLDRLNTVTKRKSSGREYLGFFHGALHQLETLS